MSCYPLILDVKIILTQLVEILYRILTMVAAKWKEHMLLYLMHRKLKQLKEKAKFRESHAQPFQTKMTKARNRIRDRSRGLAIMMSCPIGNLNGCLE